MPRCDGSPCLRLHFQEIASNAWPQRVLCRTAATQIKYPSGCGSFAFMSFRRISSMTEMISEGLLYFLTIFRVPRLRCGFDGVGGTVVAGTW